MSRFTLSVTYLLLACSVGLDAQGVRQPTLEALEKRASGLLPTPEQLRYQEIPWVHDLAEAQNTARRENRPLFLWGYGGRARPDNGLEGC